MDDSLAPGLLIAVPQLLDPNFQRSVVLLLERTDQGALGVVVNRESDLLLSELCHDHEIQYSGDPDKRVRRGGPVQPEQGLVLFGSEIDDPEARDVISGLRVSASRETLGRLCSRKAGCRFHCYSGYAGWGPEQLEREIQEGAWLVAAVDPQLILDSPTEELWNRGMDSMGIDPAALAAGGGAEA
jgi:putative transcriptional regulator